MVVETIKNLYFEIPKENEAIKVLRKNPEYTEKLLGTRFVMFTKIENSYLEFDDEPIVNTNPYQE